MKLIDLPIGENAPVVVNCIVEIPRGSSNKYEYDEELGIIKLDRALYSPLYYPADYGFIPNTRYLDGDPLDVLLAVSNPTFPGCLLSARPVAVLMMRDDKGPDEKILAVADHDPRFMHMNRLADMSQHRLAEIVHFFEVYKALEVKETEVYGWEDVEKAQELIETYRTDRK